MAAKKKLPPPSPWRIPMELPPTQEAINLAATPVMMEEVTPNPMAMEPGAVPQPLPGNKLQASQLEKVAASAPGEFGKNELTSAFEKKLGKTENVYMTPEQNTALYEAAGELPEIQAQKASLQARGELARSAFTNPTQVDYTPLLSLIDTWSGGKSKLAGAYKRPTTPQEQSKMLLDYADKQSDDQQKLFESMSKNVALMKSGTATEQYIDKLGESLGMGRTVPKASGGGKGGGRPDLLADRYLRGYRSLPNVQDAQKGLTAANEVAGFLANPNWLTDAAAKGNILQAMRMYPISDRDAALVGGSGDVASRVDRLAEKLMQGGSFTEEDRSTILQYANVLQKSKALTLKQTADDYVKGLAPDFGYGADKAHSILAPAIPKVTSGPVAEARPAMADIFRKNLTDSIKASKGGK